MISPVLRNLAEAVLLAALGVAAGLAINHRLVTAAFDGSLAAPARVVAGAEKPLPQPVLLAEVRELVGAGAVLVDARDGTLYTDGHLPGAVSLPLGEFEKLLPEFHRRIPAETTLVVYCNGYGCPDSFDLGQRLLQEGYREVRVFEGGFPEWRDAGLPLTRGGE